jgi:hypothetical protein
LPELRFEFADDPQQSSAPCSDSRNDQLHVRLNCLEPIRPSCYDKRPFVTGGEEQVSDEFREVAAKAEAHEAAVTRTLEYQPASPGLALAIVAVALMLLVATLSGNFG